MKKIAVIGSGSIGPDLCYGFASALADTDAKIFLHDISKDQLDKGIERIRNYLKKGLDRGKLSAGKVKNIEQSIKPTLEINDLNECSYVLEAATEDLETKKKILATLENVVDKNCLIGFATSGIPRRQIVPDVKYPDRCFVNHPFYPAWRSLPIELVPSDDAVITQKMYDLLIRLGKVPVLTKDVHCFAADDVFCNFECEAFRLLEDGVANLWQIDRIINEAIGGGGPFRVADMTRGNLLINHCQLLMVEGNDNNPWFKSPPILLKQGNNIWRNKEKKESSEYDDALAQQVMESILAVLFARTFFIVDNEICEPGDLDWLLKNSLGFKSGILEIAQKTGMKKVRELCEKYARKNGDFIIPLSIREERMPQYYKHVVYDEPDKDSLVTVKIRRPEAVNALNAETIAELRQVFSMLDKDNNVKGIVFTGFGKGMAGADIMELSVLKTAEECENLCKGGQQLSLEMEALSKPVVAAVDGPVLGGCAEMCMAAWARVISRDSIIAQPEVNLGIIPGYGATQRLPRIVGLEKAHEMLATASIISAEQACSIGWAFGTPMDDAIKGAKELIRKHLSGEVKLQPLNHSPLGESVRLNWMDIGHHSIVIDSILRDVLEAGLKMNLPEGMKYEAKGFGRCRNTQDMSIGMANFLQNGPIPAVFINR
jgi:enoyl-CoA hydratase / 3-hydroxyacyl-CoA dehydrogenase